MIFLNPLSDVAFKKLFANQAKSSILISFLNSILDKKEGEKIISVTITDPYNNPDTDWLKLSIVDVRCIDQAGKNYIVEIQARYQKNYPERSLYYSSLAIARQLQNKGQYNEVMPVVFVGILDFELFNKKGYVSHHKILDTETFECDLTHMEFHFIELPRFTKTLEQLETNEDKWLYLLRHASELQRVPVQLKNPDEIEDALEALEQGNMSPAELLAYDRFIDALRVEFDVIYSAKEKGLAQGLEQGLAQGLAQGLEQGLEQGKAEGLVQGKAEGLAQGERAAKEAMARVLLKEMPIEKVANITGLSLEELKKIDR